MTREPVCVIGGGVAGATAALELAARGCTVEILEAGRRLFDGVSTRQSHREHLGHHYPGDPSGRTAQLCMRGALAFERRYPGFTSGERPWFNFVVSGRDDAAAPWERSSIVSPAEYRAYCETLRALYLELSTQERDARFGPVSEFCRVLDEAEYAHLVAADRVALAVASPERVIRTESFVGHLQDRLRAEPAITVRTGHRVIAVEPRRTGYRLIVCEAGVQRALDYPQVVNATWSHAATLDEAVGRAPPPSTIRLRLITHVDLPAELAGAPSLFFTLGAFGNYTNLGRTSRSAAEAAVFYVPVCDAGSTTERDIPDDWKALIADGLDPARAIEVGHEVVRGLARFVPALARARLRETRVGTVITRGDADIWDRDSAVHHRFEAGVESLAPGWHSVNIAKLTYCVWVADAVASAVLEHAGLDPARRVAQGAAPC
ncbi:MAG TPA: FAD-dependent oxidoreductase [Kofleriaceae bacterium]|nr:FAD-dependent oxidoreductase [Kofleriaceae bacterium]